VVAAWYWQLHSAWQREQLARDEQTRSDTLKAAEKAAYDFRPSEVLVLLDGIKMRWPEWADNDDDHRRLRFFLPTSVDDKTEWLSEPHFDSA
jgi:hypothetical protein